MLIEEAWKTVEDLADQSGQLNVEAGSIKAFIADIGRRKNRHATRRVGVLENNELSIATCRNRTKARSSC
jgi:hypothetical protein